MNQMIEKLVNNVPQIGRYYADLVNFVSYIDSKYGAAIMAATPYVILGSIFISMYVSRCWGSERGPISTRSSSLAKLHGGPILTRSRSLAELHGGDLALQRFAAYNEARVNPATLDKAEILLKALLDQEHPDFKCLQNTVAKLEMSGREETAVDLLEKARDARLEADKQHEAYEIEMLLVEMLIYKGDYDKATKCKCLDDEHIADARRPLYKAILHIMHPKRKGEDGNELSPEKLETDLEGAQNFWDEFVRLRKQFTEINISTPLQIGAYDTINDFDQFAKKVEEVGRRMSEVGEKQKGKK